MHEQNVKQAVGTLRPGAAMLDGRLSILPLRSDVKVGARYVLLEQAISRGTLAITEVSEAGSVPYLQAVNQGPWPVLIFDGEELVGAKQNRIANATILVGVGKSMLPVSCVEQGRWSQRSAAFGAGAYASHPTLRRQKERQVFERSRAASPRFEAEATSALPSEEAQLLRARRFSSDQGRVWEEVGRSSRSLGSESPTMAMADAYETGKNDVEKTMQALRLDASCASDDTVGVMVFLGGQFVCMDVLRPAKRFLGLYPKLLRGYALEALLHKMPAAKDFDAEAAAFRILAEILEARVDEQAAADLGWDLRLETKRVSGSALVWEEELVQLSMFPKAVA